MTKKQPSQADLEREDDTIVDAEIVVDTPSTEIEVREQPAPPAVVTPRDRTEKMLRHYLSRRDLGIRRRAEQLAKTVATWEALDSRAAEPAGRQRMFAPVFVGKDLDGNEFEVEIAGDIYAHHWPPPELVPRQSGAQLGSNVWPQPQPAVP